MLSIKVKTPPDVASELAGRVKARRLELNLTQATFAAKAGLKLPTYRLFERTGQISLRGLLQCGFALDMLADFDAVFAQENSVRWKNIWQQKNRRAKERPPAANDCCSVFEEHLITAFRNNSLS